MEVRLTKQNGKFVPSDHLTAEDMQSIAEGEYFTAKLTRPRNLGHHRKFFGAVNIVFEMQDKYATTEHLLNAIKIDIGHCERYKVKQGRNIIEVAVPKSISFGNMKQSAFEEFYDRAIQFILADILPHTNRHDLEAHLMEVLG